MFHAHAARQKESPENYCAILSRFSSRADDSCRAMPRVFLIHTE